MIYFILVSILTVLFVIVCWTVNWERKREKKQYEKKREDLKKRYEEVEKLKEKLDTGNSQSDFDNCIDVMHNLSNQNK